MHLCNQIRSVHRQPFYHPIYFSTIMDIKVWQKVNTEKPASPFINVDTIIVLFSSAYSYLFFFVTTLIKGEEGILGIFKIFATYYVHDCRRCVVDWQVHIPHFIFQLKIVVVWRETSIEKPMFTSWIILWFPFGQRSF